MSPKALDLDLADPSDKIIDILEYIYISISMDKIKLLLLQATKNYEKTQNLFWIKAFSSQECLYSHTMQHYNIIQFLLYMLNPF